MSLDILRRRSGLMVPLSSLRSRRDCGVGDVGALPPFLDWMDRCGLRVLQLLPLNALAPLDSCPYSAISAMALDVAYVCLDEVPEVSGSAELRAEIDAARKAHSFRQRCLLSRRTRFAEAREFKVRMLELAFAEFERDHWDRDTPREKEFLDFTALHRDWLDDYALFCVIKEWTGWESWTRWPRGLKERSPQELGRMREKHSRRIRFYQYLQWLVYGQWAAVRREASRRDILLFGDIPFGLNLESADVWARQEEFDFSATMGAPPDQYSAVGQSWGLPAYRWARMEDGGHLWWRMRVRQATELYDIFRMDHAVGFFRTWVIGPGPGQAAFDVPDGPEQRARGERFFRMVLSEAGRAHPVAEDLGLIPPFVHEVLGALGIPGYKVARWQTRHDGSFIHPREFPPLSVATHGNHDTSTLPGWWREIPPEERSRYWRTTTGAEGPAPRFSPAVHEALLSALYEAGSAMMLLQFQDVVGSRIRVNVPGTVGPHNWTYRIPWAVEDFGSVPRVGGRGALLRRLAESSGRVETAGKTC